ncbi:HAD-IIA family hydrolase [Nonomuraea deserti]|uniref:HAD-IIA family hydrolase n=1 Tax=Nonomuraea deserti TaxID=1848322 RepID=A0A4R4VMA5_9ACTN|nr:HAD-IIA family hydrolase [Nonomuraea deserti]
MQPSARRGAYRAVICDLDGTVYRAGRPLPGAVEALGRMRAANVPVLFVSNNPTRSSASYAERLRTLGVAAEPEDVLTSGGVVIDWLLAEAAGAQVLLVGEPSLHAEFAGHGIGLVDSGRDADVVVASFDRTFDYRKWMEAFCALRAGARFVATNPDPTCPVDEGEVPDCGGIIAALEVSVGRRVEVVVGKPSAMMAHAALNRLQAAAHEVLVVGDRLETDVRLGTRNGLDTALVLTGVTDPTDLHTALDQPTLVLDDLTALPSLVGLAEPEAG